MAEPTHRIFFGPTGQHLAEVAMSVDQLELADQMMRGSDGVLTVQGETITYRIAGRSIVAVVEIPERPPEEEKPVIRVRINMAARPPRIESLDEKFVAAAAQLDATFAGYVRAGLTTTEAAERLQGLPLPFTLEIING